MAFAADRQGVQAQDYENVPDGAASLAFVFDITGSMYDDLVQVIEGAAKILATTLSRREKPLYNYVLVPFHDPVVGPVVVTTDPEDFQYELRNLYVQGGGDCPEMSIGAIKEAIDVCLPNSFIYVFTDARSKDFYLTEEVLALIQKKQSQVVFVLTGDCDDPTHEGFRAYEQIASTSSGQVFLLKKSQVNEVLNFVRVAVQSRKVNLMSVDQPTASSNTFMLPIDSKLQEITISVSGQKPRITLVDPSGNRVTQKNGLKTLLDIQNALIQNIKKPLPGQWRMEVTSEGPHTIRVTGLSTTDFSVGFSRRTVNNMQDTDHRPVGGIPMYIFINGSDLVPPAGFSRIELLDLNGRALVEYPLIRNEVDPKFYSVEPFTPPEEYFYVKVSGIDDKGYVIQRLTPTAITRILPGKPKLWMPEVTRGYFGSLATIRCQVESLVPYTVKWYSEDIQLGDELYFSESDNATLEIPNANQFTEGIYFCNATNTAGSRAIPTFLDISEPPPAITPPKNVSVLPGEDAMVSCNVFSTVDFNITWHRRGYLDRLRNSKKFTIYTNGSLIVRNVGRDDEGAYKCRASNEGGFKEEKAYVRVQVAPTAVIIPQKSNFVVGQSLELICHAKGYPSPSVYWLRGGKIMVANENIRIHGNELTLRNMHRGDGGRYACRAQNSAGEFTAIATLNYMEPPHISLYESRVLVASGDEATLFCAADGIPKPKIRWYRGDVELKAVSYVQITDSGQLKIIGTQELDAGEYRCEAVNDAGKDSALIRLEVGSDPVIIEGPINQGVDIGGNATMTCTVEGLPKPTQFWRRQDGKKLDLGGRMRQLPSGELFIRNVGIKDEGMYVCVAQNQFGTTELSGYLTITGIVQPLIGYMNPIVNVIQGEDMELNCEAIIGNPKPKVLWLQDGQVLRTDGHIKKNSNGNLVIKDIQSYHDGDYICLATNVGGNASIIVSVDVQVPPTFDMSDPDAVKIDFNIDEGDRIVLPCAVEGDPPPVVTWYKDESPIALTDYHYFILEDGSLEIYTADASDTATYRCAASNIAGDIEKIVNLFVRVLPKISGEPTEQYTVTENESVTLPCEVSGTPTPRVSWRKNFVNFEPKSDRFIFGDYGLTITETKVTDKAIYECIASNVAGNETKVITLIIEISPSITSESPTEMVVLKGQEVVLGCENIGFPKPEVEWIKDENPISVFNGDTGLEFQGTGSLRIASVRISDSGRYICVVSNDAGIETRDFSLLVQDPPRLRENLTRHKDVIENNPIVLLCPAAGTPTPLITWYKDDVLITGDQLGFVILEDGSLQVSDSEAADSGVYRCVAENDAGRVDHDVELKVLVPPKIIGADFGKQGVPEKERVIVSRNVTFTCQVESDPESEIRWLRDNFDIDLRNTRYSVSEDGKELTITAAEIDDTGTYTCIAWNIAGEAEKNFELDVQVPPSIDTVNASPSNSTVIKNNPLYLDCPVTGIPRPKVFWYKDGEIVSPDLDPNLRLLAEGRRLEIIGARVTDAGSYKCVGENVAGKTEIDFEVGVHVPPKVDQPGRVDTPETVRDSSVSLTCPASGIPLPQITWYKNSQPIKQNTTEYILLNEGWTLKILSASDADSTRFTCRAKNTAGQSEKAFDLNVLVPPYINRDKILLNPKVVINQTTVINCPAEGKPSPEITWYKNGIQLDATLQKRHEILAGGRQLRVKGAQLTDAGTYQCLAVNKAGEDSVDFQLKVLVPSRIEIPRIYNKNRKVVLDGSLTITCPAKGVPPPIITWYRYKDGVEVELTDFTNVEISEDGKQLTILEAKEDDTARYTCKAKNEAGQSEIAYNVAVQVPPSINKDDINPNPTVVIDDSVVLDCPAVGIPDPEVIWLKDGEPLDYENNRQYTLQANGKRLHIQSADEDDGGTYTCVAANEAGSTEEVFDLDVWVPPHIDDTNLEKNPKVNKGHTSVLYCPVEGNPPPEILWLKDGEPVQLDNRITIQTEGNQLRIQNASVSDTATYTCRARNQAGQDTVSFDLEVQVPPSIDESNVVYNRKVVENRTVLIECPVSGIPTPEVKWLINDHPLHQTEELIFTNNGYHLEILSAQVTDSAVYTCVASNEAGTLRKKFNVEVQVPPKINQEHLHTKLKVPQNLTAYIDCPVYGIPQPSIIWLKDGFPLLDWPYPDLLLVGNDRRLEVSNVQVDDGGTYTCQATNPAGQIKQEFTLEVHVPPVIGGSRQTEHVPVVKGKAVTLDCIVTGIPQPRTTWFKDSSVIILSENPNIRILNNGQALQITNADTDDTGLYLCHAENDAGISEKSYDVEVQVPATIEGSDRLQTVWVTINNPLTLDCPAEGTPTPKIYWMRQDKIIQAYGNPSVRIEGNGRKLLLVSAQLPDLGDYKCFAENMAGNDSIEYLVSVYVPPIIDEGHTKIQAIVNNGAVLPCDSQGLPEPVTTWEKDGEIFPTTGLRHQMQRFGSLEFVSVRLEDAGIYRCTASNEAGNVSREIQLDVQVPPRIPWEQPMKKDAVVGRDVILPCEVIGTPTPKILWQKGARAVQGSDSLTIFENGTLYLHNTSMEDSGVYICIARNDAGTAFGRIRLRVQVPPKISTRQKKDFVVSNGDNIVLPCRARGRPHPKITWMKNGRAVASSNLFLRILRTGLAIPFARPEDAGTYTCVATNKAGQETVDMTLTVQVPPKIGETTRLLTYSVAEEAKITCPAIGIPPPEISWMKDGRTINTALLKYDIEEFGTLLIHDLTEEDTGSYICTASNRAGRATKERLLRIQVPPSFIVIPQQQEVLLNSRLVLRCTASGIPTPNIHWKRNDAVVPSLRSVNGISAFTIQNVRREDGGMYTCIAKNPAGEAESYATVVVKVPPEILGPPGNKAITIADKVVLECSVSGDPPPEVFWMKNGRPLELSERIQQLNNGSLVIYQSTSSDAGEYKCVATNDAGTSEEVAMLTVRAPPSFRIEPTDTTVDQGSNVRMDCVGDGEPEPKMNWMIGWDILEDEGRLSILPNNSLRIVAAQLSDSNAYRCLASNNLGKTFVEVNLTVVVHGQWSDWSDWEACSETCGQGMQLRHRLCASPEPANGGQDCVGLPVESQPCMIRQCPVDGQWGRWLPWEECSTTCDVGQKVRRRLCDSPRQQYGGKPCLGDGSEVMECNLRPCAVDGGWGEWGSWQPCSSTCGEGLKERVRQCDNPPPVHRGAFCAGSGVERETCKLKECPVDGIWGQWGQWATCTHSCGGGTRTRLRLCNSPAPDYGGLFCVGTDSQVDYCNNEPCPVHGNWSQWGEFGTCSKSCNGGLRRRFRTCTNPTPSGNGRPCVGQGEDTETCNHRPCPVDGLWGEWSSWTQCSKTCDRGIKERSRQCRQPKHGGKRCLGDSVQRAECLLESCFTIPLKAEGNLVGYINNIDIPASTFTADMLPLPDNSATRVNATFRNVPKAVVHHFRHLVSLLAPIYWTTAKELDGAFNGFSLTEGDFTREVQVEYTTGEILKMSHYSKGVDRNGVLQLDLVVRGKVPEFPETQLVKVKPYWEEYLQTGEGTVHAHSTRLFNLDDDLLPYAWNHSITYNQVENKMPYLVQRLYARGMEVDINPIKEIVLLQLDASIGPGSPSNQCPTGFTLDPAGPFCVDDDECARLKPCSDFCHNSPGSFACSCPFGYALDIDGRNCLDIDECSTAAAGCRSDQECVNTIGSYMCAAVCRHGFKRSEDGQTCIDVNECEETPGVCDQICVNRYGSYRCRCRPGYRRLSRGRCRDINECKLTSSPCSQLCTNSLGSYQCSCQKGYELVRGGLCRDINECTEGGSTCSPGQNCVNSIGSYKCISLCPKGSYMEDGKCRDVNECAIGKHRCYSNQRCINTDPGYRCLCPRGYKSAGPGTPCLDINECEENPSICSYQCKNIQGGFECICAPGQVRLADRRSCAGLEFLEPALVIDTNTLHSSPSRKESQTDRSNNNVRSKRSTRLLNCPQGMVYNASQDICLDINECEEDRGICQHNCTNTIGSYKCSCPPGYRLSVDGRTCEDIDECIEYSQDCGPEKMCFNTRGEFTCIDIPCPEKYQRDPLTSYCVLECIDAEIACPTNAKIADIIEFRTLALPSGVVAHQDLIRLIAYNQNNEILTKTVFKILENDKKIQFQIRLENGIGIVSTLQPLEDQQVYKIKVRARSYDNSEINIQYQTTFIIHISVSAYPY